MTPRLFAMSRSYWICRFNQSCADAPRYVPSRSAVSAAYGRGTPTLPPAQASRRS